MKKEVNKSTKVIKKDKTKKNDKSRLASFKSKYLTKVNVTYASLLLIDIILVIYLARQNIVNYVVISDIEVFVSKTKYLLWGRNYVNLIVIPFIYIYTCLINKFFLKRKNTKKYLILLLIGITILNCLLFIIFTKKVY